MRNNTKKLFTGYVDRIAQLNNVAAEDVKEGFSVEPTAEQKLVDKITLSSDFLQHINVISVTNQIGERIGLSVANAIASTTDTDGKERETKSISKLDSRKYHCESVNFDTHISYQLLDQWAKFPDFQTRLAKQTQKTIGLNLIMMGFNGTSRSENSDLSRNKLLQDVKKGFLQKIREEAPLKVMDGKNSEKKIKVGKGQGTGEDAKGYENLDALVFDATNKIIAEEYADDTELVVICGRNILADKYFQMINKTNQPTEELAGQVILSQKQIGGLKAIRVPYFPANSMLITRLDNLSIYLQEGSLRRAIINNPKRNRIEDFISKNIDFIVENYDCAALIENIVFEDKAVADTSEY